MIVSGLISSGQIIRFPPPPLTLRPHHQILGSISFVLKKKKKSPPIKGWFRPPKAQAHYEELGLLFIYFISSSIMWTFIWSTYQVYGLFE